MPPIWLNFVDYADPASSRHRSSLGNGYKIVKSIQLPGPLHSPDCQSAFAPILHIVANALFALIHCVSEFAVH